MDLNIVLKGQSNAALFTSQGGLTFLQDDVDQLLGFDGATNKVDVTSYTAPGTGLVPDPTFPNISTWLTGSAATGYGNGALETGFVNQLAALPAVQKAAPTVILDMQNESDTANPDLSVQDEINAIFYEMTQARAVLGQSAATAPVVFMDTPYPDGQDYTGEAIKTAMQQLSSAPSFNATIAASYSDVDMNYDGGVNGGPHLGANDITQVALRTALTVADAFSAYALPGSPISQGLQDWSGPQGVSAATTSNPDQVLVTVAPGTASSGLAALNGTAAGGEGFSLQLQDGSLVQATATKEVDATHLLVDFGSTAATSNETVYYDYGVRRLSDQPDQPNPPGLSDGRGNQVNTGNGYGTAVYDDHGLPLSLPGTGLGVDDGTVSADMLAKSLGSGAVGGTAAGSGAAGASGATSGLTFLAEARALVLTDTGIGPDAPTISAISQALASGTTLTQMASAMLGIPGPLFNHAGETSAQFVADLFGNGFGIQATADQVAPFAAAIDGGTLSKASVLVAIATSPAYAVHDHAWLSANGIG